MIWELFCWGHCRQSSVQLLARVYGFCLINQVLSRLGNHSHHYLKTNKIQKQSSTDEVPGVPHCKIQDTLWFLLAIGQQHASLFAYQLPQNGAMSPATVYGSVDQCHWGDQYGRKPSWSLGGALFKPSRYCLPPLASGHCSVSWLFDRYLLLRYAYHCTDCFLFSKLRYFYFSKLVILTDSKTFKTSFFSSSESSPRSLCHLSSMQFSYVHVIEIHPLE